MKIRSFPEQIQKEKSEKKPSFEDILYLYNTIKPQEVENPEALKEILKAYVEPDYNIYKDELNFNALIGENFLIATYRFLILSYLKENCYKLFFFSFF